MISMIAAHGSNRVIGKDGEMPWHLPEDLKYFKNTTTGKTLLMGRKTFEAMNGPLKNRRNIVLTSNQDWSHEGAEVVCSLEDGLAKLNEEDEGFVIGGGEIYKAALKHADRLYITLIHETFDGDAYFPEYSTDEWTEISREKGIKNEKNPYDYEFIIFDRK
ncbi:dihydrofolate reductase [Jeotgalibacillus sp. R-1-5s-1]|uniref:dihydrofolate reductase n=1 Tax=Jeotgalibacillus sp. R-1-5s-1 TaxID=2555897 RepID=UPI00106992B4|nr:dihydrofolate reductase [Jeotgalibacillus sp. R-1-5s-1]TFE03272.1 dihydrofolate reductase [Jeotgalibacillus sp. R-1-5s-1]